MFISTIFLTLLAACHCKIEISERARNFSMELLYFTAEQTDWHTVISPLGVWSLLSAVSMGASGDSRKQLRHGLFLPSKDTFLDEYKTFMEDVFVNETSDVALKTENYIFLDRGFTTKAEFQKNLAENFGVRVGRLRFSSPKTAAIQANKVVRYSGVINFDVFEEKDFDGAKMILTNLISFKGHWQLPFNASETNVESFYNEEGEVIGHVNMMQQEAEVQFVKMVQVTASVLRLPYGEDENFSFLVFLPYEGANVTSVFSALAKFSIKGVLDRLKRGSQKFGKPTVDIKIPRFQISTNFMMNVPLHNMGIISIFDPGANSFDRISDSSDLYVSAIVHKAEIRVTEIGTTASASSSAYFERRALPSKFNANRPFIYLIVKESTATIIFSGVYSKPTLF